MRKDDLIAAVALLSYWWQKMAHCSKDMNDFHRSRQFICLCLIIRYFHHFAILHRRSWFQEDESY